VRRALAALGLGAAAIFASHEARAACPAGSGDCQPLLESGATGNRVDFVIVGDGYTEAERDEFFADAAAVATSFETTSTYASYAPVFNVWALFVPSPESGADDPETGTMVDTAFDATYGAAGISYLISVNNSKVFGELNDRFPEFDIPICIVNAEPYGGSGGPVAVASTHDLSVQILEHELGHSFGGLADEYETPYPGYPPGDPEPNVSLEENLSPLKWSVWVDAGTPIPTPESAATSEYTPVGAYEGARYLTEGVFRPTPNCLMRELGKDFCPVCSEAMVLGFSELSLLVDSFDPPEGTAIPAKGPSTFGVVGPELAGVTYAWAVDGAPLDGAAASVAVDPSSIGLADGAHQITVTVHDATPLVREDPDMIMTESYSWGFVVDASLPPIGGSGGGGEGAGGEGGGPDGPDEPEDDGCGCRTGGEPERPAGAFWLAAGALAVVARRRRARRT
jgi:MYXO-CTERM domain-containing protein